MYVLLAFDTEDVYFPPEYRIDDIPGWLARTLSEVGITGTFFVMGEKAEELLRRGRRDVLEQMRPHAIASHQQGNRYPLLPQVVAGKGWDDGMAAVRQYEDWVSERLVAAFGRPPVGFSRHNCYFAPQHVAVAGERGLPYMYLPLQIPGSSQPLWYANALTFPSAGPSTYDGFDRIYSRDDQFARHFAGLEAFVRQRLEAGDEWICVFGCHPVQVMAREWLEHHALASGRARSPQELGWHYRVKPRHEEERAKANFRRLCVFLKEHPDLEVVGLDEAARLFGHQPGQIGRDQLVAYAQDLVREERICLHQTFSPAELLCALAESLAAAGPGGDLPEEVPRRAALGPPSRPRQAPELETITRAELGAACQRLVEHVRARGELAANVALARGELGLGQLALLCGRAYLAEARYDRYERLAVPAAPRYPQVAYTLDAFVREAIGDHWAMPLDFSCEALAEQARLQTWTVKPAWLSPPPGPVCGRPYAGRVRWGAAP